MVKIRITEWVERLEMVKDLLKEKDNFKKNTKGTKNAIMPQLIESVELAIDYIQSAPMVKPAMKMEKVLEEFLKELGGFD